MQIAFRNMRVPRRFVALAIAYVLALQALFAGGAQLRVALAETPGICTLLGFQQPDTPSHKTGVCAMHCVAHASLDAANLLPASAILIAIWVWRRSALPPAVRFVRAELGYRGRAPPRR